MNLELEVLQQIYVQKIKIFGHVGWLAIKDVNILHQDVSGFACYLNDKYWACLLDIEDVDIFCQDVSIFHALK